MARSDHWRSRLHAEMVSDLVEGHLQLPPLHKPGDDLLGTSIQVSAEEGLGWEGVLGIADEHPAGGNGRHVGSIPDRPVGDDLNGTIPHAIAAGHRDGRPARCQIDRPSGEGGKARAHETRTPHLPRTTWGSRREELRIEAQAGDDRGSLACRCQEGNGSIFTICDDDQLAGGVPAMQQPDHLPGPVGDRLVAPPVLRVGPFGWCQDGQEGQGPDAIGPGDRHQQQHAGPAQAAGPDEVGVTGPHRIAIDPLRADLGTSSPLNRLVNADHQRPSRYTRRDQQTEQDATDGQARLDGTTEDPVVRPEGGEVLQA